MKVVLDTNVLVSGLMRASTPPGRLIDFVRAGSLVPVVDDRILDEYSEVLHRPELQAYFTSADVESILDFMRRDADHVTCETVTRALPDPDDTPFLEVALAARAVLITGNARHFPVAQRANCLVLTPREFLGAYLGEGEGPSP